MLLLATRLARKEESALVLMVLPQRLSLVEEASVLILSLMVEETAMVPFFAQVELRALADTAETAATRGRLL